MPAAFAGILYMPVTWLCSALLVNRPYGYSEMGIFSAADQWFGVILFLPGLLGNVILPVMSEQIGQNDKSRSAKTMLLGIKVNALLVLPIVLIGSIASPYIMNIYGEGFRSGWPTLVVVMFTAGFMACETPIIQILVASGRMWLNFWLNLVWAVTFIVSTLLLVDFGAFGLASARSIAFLVQSVTVIAFAIWIIRGISTVFGNE